MPGQSLARVACVCLRPGTSAASGALLLGPQRPSRSACFLWQGVRVPNGTAAIDRLSLSSRTRSTSRLRRRRRLVPPCQRSSFRSGCLARSLPGLGYSSRALLASASFPGSFQTGPEGEESRVFFSILQKSISAQPRFIFQCVCVNAYRLLILRLAESKAFKATTVINSRPPLPPPPSPTRLMARAAASESRLSIAIRKDIGFFKDGRVHYRTLATTIGLGTCKIAATR